jgi:hypothetical protein
MVGLATEWSLSIQPISTVTLVRGFVMELSGFAVGDW